MSFRVHILSICTAEWGVAISSFRLPTRTESPKSHIKTRISRALPLVAVTKYQNNNNPAKQQARNQANVFRWNSIARNHASATLCFKGPEWPMCNTYQKQPVNEQSPTSISFNIGPSPASTCRGRRRNGLPQGQAPSPASSQWSDIDSAARQVSGTKFIKNSRETDARKASRDQCTCTSKQR